jgi:hypothetical protein
VPSIHTLSRTPTRCRATTGRIPLGSADLPASLGRPKACLEIFTTQVDEPRHAPCRDASRPVRSGVHRRPSGAVPTRDRLDRESEKRPRTPRQARGSS